MDLLFYNVYLLTRRWLFSLALTGTLLAADTPSVNRVRDIFHRLEAAYHQKRSGKTVVPVSFQADEADINEYLKVVLKYSPRPGLEKLSVKFFPGNYVSTLSEIDFDAIEKWKPGTIPKVLSPLLSGKKTVWIDVRFRAQNGHGTFNIEKAYFQSVRLPALVVEKLMQVVAARQPEHYDLTKPVPLPFDLRQVWTAEQKVGGET